MASMTVRSMTEAEFDAWHERSLLAYAEEHVAAGTWSPGDAVSRAREQTREILPAGFATDGMLFLTGLGPDGEVVGHVWVALDHPSGIPDCAWIYDIEVVEASRGAGYGRALLTATEARVLAAGVTNLMLNVFGTNDAARNLYQSCGYQVVTQEMRKSLS